MIRVSGLILKEERKKEKETNITEFVCHLCTDVIDGKRCCRSKTFDGGVENGFLQTNPRLLVH